MKIRTLPAEVATEVCKMAACNPYDERIESGEKISIESLKDFAEHVNKSCIRFHEEIDIIDKDLRNKEEFMSILETRNYNPEYLKSDAAENIRKLFKVQLDLLGKNKIIMTEIQHFTDGLFERLAAKERGVKDEAENKQKLQSTETLLQDEKVSGTVSARLSGAEKDEGADWASSAVHSSVKEELQEPDLEVKQRKLKETRAKLEDLQERKNNTWMKNENLLQRLNKFLMEKGLDLSAEETENAGEASWLQAEAKKDEESSFYETVEEKSDDESTKKTVWRKKTKGKKKHRRH